MKKIMHFHPNGNYAKKFIGSLQNTEFQLGFESIMINQIFAENLDHQIDFVITKKKLWKLPFNFIILFFLIYRTKPDIIFAHNSTASILPLLVSKLLFVKKRIYFNHGVPYIAYKGILSYCLYFIEKLNCFLCSDIICVSKAMKKILSRISQKKIIIISDGSASGIDFDDFVIEKKHILRTRKINKLRSNDKIILFVGRANYRKGFYDIMQIWEKYFKFKSDYKLIMLGIKKTDILKLYNKIPENVIPMSFVTKSENFFVIADYLLVTSYHEGLNYSILEALMTKTLVISNKFLGVSEIIKNNLNGFLIKNNNHQNFFNKIIYCEKNSSTKKTILENGFNSVKKYERKVFLKHYTKFIKNL